MRGRANWCCRRFLPATEKSLAVGAALVEGQTAEVHRLEQAVEDSFRALYILMGSLVFAAISCAALVSWRFGRGLARALSAAGAAARRIGNSTSRLRWVGPTRSAN